MAKEGFILYRSMYEPIRSLTYECKGMLLEAIYEYQISGETPKSDSPIYIPFMFFKNQFDIDEKKYKDKCLKNSDIAKKRWHANACERIQTVTNDADIRYKIEDTGYKIEDGREGKKITLKTFSDETEKSTGQKNEGATTAGQGRTETPPAAQNALHNKSFHASTAHRARLIESATLIESWYRALKAKIPAAVMADLLAQIETWDLLFDAKYPNGSSFDEYRKHHLWRLNDLKMLPVKAKGEQQQPVTTTKPTPYTRKRS